MRMSMSVPVRGRRRLPLARHHDRRLLDAGNRRDAALDLLLQPVQRRTNGRVDLQRDHYLGAVDADAADHAGRQQALAAARRGNGVQHLTHRCFVD